MYIYIHIEKERERERERESERVRERERGPRRRARHEPAALAKAAGEQRILEGSAADRAPGLACNRI